MVRSQEAGLSTCFALVLQRLQVFRMSEQACLGAPSSVAEPNAKAPAHLLGGGWVRHGWGRDVWRPPWSKVGPTSKHFHMKASPSHSQGRSSRGAIAPPPSDPRRPPSQGFLELQANDGNADNTGWETPEGNAEGDAQSLWSHDSDGERCSQSAGHWCYEST